MIRKPDIFIKAPPYGDMTESEYEWLAGKLAPIDLETLNNLVKFVYREGIKDGIEFYRELET